MRREYIHDLERLVLAYVDTSVVGPGDLTLVEQAADRAKRREEIRTRNREYHRRSLAKAATAPKRHPLPRNWK